MLSDNAVPWRPGISSSKSVVPSIPSPIIKKKISLNKEEEITGTRKCGDIRLTVSRECVRYGYSSITFLPMLDDLDGLPEDEDILIDDDEDLDLLGLTEEEAEEEFGDHSQDPF